MKRFIWAALLAAAALCAGLPAAAQTAGLSKVTSACATSSFTAGSLQYNQMDPTGVLCTSPASSSVTVTNPFDLEATQLSVLSAVNALVAAAANPAGIIGTNGTTIASAANPFDVKAVGPAASGATATGNPLLDGCRAATASPTAVTDGQVIARQCGAEGAAVVRPYAIKEIQVRGSTGATATGTQVSILASAGGSLKNYVTDIECSNSGATTSILTFTDAAATVLINPAGGGSSHHFHIPLVTAAATAFQVTFGSASTSQYCSAQGYTGL